MLEVMEALNQTWSRGWHVSSLQRTLAGAGWLIDDSNPSNHKSCLLGNAKRNLADFNYSFEQGKSSSQQLTTWYLPEEVKRYLAMSDKPPPYPGMVQPQQPGYPSSGSGYAPLPQQPVYPPTGTTTTIIQQPAVVSAPFFGDTPVQTVCTNCGANVITSLMYENGQLTWLACVGLCLIG